MTDEQIKRCVREFRKGILDDDPSAGMCFVVCAPLLGYLNALGCDATLGRSSVEEEESLPPEPRGYCNHVWIKLRDGRVLDPTADQFSKPGRRLPQVYLGPPIKELHTRPEHVAAA